MPEPIRVALASDPGRPRLVLAAGGHVNDVLATHLGDAFAVVATVSLLDELAGVLDRERPDVVLVSRFLPSGQGDLAAQWPALRAAAPRARFVLLTGPLDDGARALIQAGATYGVYNVVGGAEPDVADIRAACAEDRRWEDVAPWLPEGFQGVAPPPRPAVVVTAPPAAPPPAPQLVLAHTIAVVSGKAGVGKTTVAANLLAAARPLGAVGIDMDYEKPDLAFAFQPEPHVRGDLRDLLALLNLAPGAALSRADAGVVADWCQRLPDPLEGITLIPGPSRDAHPAPVPPALAAELRRVAMARARVVVVDTAFELADEPTLDLVVDDAVTLLIVTTPERAALYQTAWLLRQLDLLKVPHRRLKLVVTAAGQKGHPSAREAAQHLDLPLALALPYDPVAYERARTTGRPVALGEGERGPYHQLLAACGVAVDPRPARRPWFRRRAIVKEA